MKLTKEQKAAHRAAFRAMSPTEKLDYIAEYYKWPILLMLLVLSILAWAGHRQLTKKEPVLYLALANVAVGEDLEQALTVGFLTATGGDPDRQEVGLYRDLYLSDDADVLNHEYAYASRIKVMGAIQTQKLDVVLMNREAYDMFSLNGYLLDLSSLTFASGPMLSGHLTSNDVIVTDNVIEWQLNEADTHERITESVSNGIEVSDCPLFHMAGLEGRLYAGIIANSPRTEESIRYLQFIIAND